MKKDEKSLLGAFATSDWEVIELGDAYWLNHNPLEGFENLIHAYSWPDGTLEPNYGQDPVYRIAAFLEKSRGGCLLVSGYRGVGKSSTVNKAIMHVNRLARRTICFINNYLYLLLNPESLLVKKQKIEINKSGILLKALISFAREGEQPLGEYLSTISKAIEQNNELLVCSTLNKLIIEYLTPVGKENEEKYLFLRKSGNCGEDKSDFILGGKYIVNDVQIEACKVDDAFFNTYRRQPNNKYKRCELSEHCYLSAFFNLECQNNTTDQSEEKSEVKPNCGECDQNKNCEQPKELTCSGCGGMQFCNDVQYYRIPINLNTSNEAQKILFQIIIDLYELLKNGKLLEAIFLEEDTSEKDFVNITRRQVLQQLERAYKRISRKTLQEELSGQDENTELGFIRGIAWKFGKSKSERKQEEDLPYGLFDAQSDIKQILNKLPNHIRIIFVFDELDKLQVETPDEEALKAEERRKKDIEDAISVLKPILTETNAHFIFVAGKETGIRWIEDLSKGAGLYEGVFSQHVYVPSLFKTRPQDRRLVEKIAQEYLLPSAKGKREYKDLGNFEKHFARYLTFKSRGIRRKALKELHRYTYWSHEKGGVKKARLVFNLPDIKKIRFYSRVQSVLDSMGARIENLDDKSLVAIFYMVDFILKFYKTGFSIIDIETSSAVLEHTESAPSRDLIQKVINAFMGKFLVTTSGSLASFRFRVSVSRDIEQLVNYMDEEHSEFHFTEQDFHDLSRSLEAKDKLLKEDYHQAEFHSLRVQESLGELYFRIGNYNEAMLVLQKAIRLGNFIFKNYSGKKGDSLAASNLFTITNLLIRANILLGAIFESDLEYDSAINYYTQALHTSYLYIELFNKENKLLEDATKRLDEEVVKMIVDQIINEKIPGSMIVSKKAKQDIRKLVAVLPKDKKDVSQSILKLHEIFTDIDTKNINQEQYDEITNTLRKSILPLLDTLIRRKQNTNDADLKKTIEIRSRFLGKETVIDQANQKYDFLQELSSRIFTRKFSFDYERNYYFPTVTYYENKGDPDNKLNKIKDWFAFNSPDIQRRCHVPPQLFHILNLLGYVNYKKDRLDICLKYQLHALMAGLNEGDVSSTAVQANRIGDALFNYRTITWAKPYYLYSIWLASHDPSTPEVRGRSLSDLMNVMISETEFLAESSVTKDTELVNKFKEYSMKAVRDFSRGNDCIRVIDVYRRRGYFYFRVSRKATSKSDGQRTLIAESLKNFNTALALCMKEKNTAEVDDAFAETLRNLQRVLSDGIIDPLFENISFTHNPDGSLKEKPTGDSEEDKFKLQVWELTNDLLQSIIPYLRKTYLDRYFSPEEVNDHGKISIFRQLEPLKDIYSESNKRQLALLTLKIRHGARTKTKQEPSTSSNAPTTAMTTAQIQALTSDQITTLTVAQVQVLTTEQLTVMTTAQIKALHTEQFAALTIEQVQTLNTNQITALTKQQVQALKMEDIVSLAIEDKKKVYRPIVSSTTITFMEFLEFFSVAPIVITRRSIDAKVSRKASAVAASYYHQCYETKLKAHNPKSEKPSYSNKLFDFSLIRAVECAYASRADTEYIAQGANGCYHVANRYLKLAEILKSFIDDFDFAGYISENFTETSLLNELKRHSPIDSALIFFSPYFIRYRVLNIGTFMKFVTDVSPAFSLPENATKDKLIDAIKDELTTKLAWALEQTWHFYRMEYQTIRSGYPPKKDKTYLWDSFENSEHHAEISEHIMHRGDKNMDTIIRLKKNETGLPQQSVELDESIARLNLIHSDSDYSAHKDEIWGIIEKLTTWKGQKLAFTDYNNETIQNYEKSYSDATSDTFAVFKIPFGVDRKEELSLLINDTICAIQGNEFPV